MVAYSLGNHPDFGAGFCLVGREQSGSGLQCLLVGTPIVLTYGSPVARSMTPQELIRLLPGFIQSTSAAGVATIWPRLNCVMCPPVLGKVSRHGISWIPAKRKRPGHIHGEADMTRAWEQMRPARS